MAPRGGHFDGVATVVLRLFNMVQRMWRCSGKDFQQLRVIQYMVRELSCRSRSCRRDQREADGLALSSRNQYLSAEECDRTAESTAPCGDALGLAARASR